MESLVCVQDYENAALKKLPKQAGDYFRSGALSEETLRENRRVYSRYRIRPKVLRDVSKMDLSVKVLGEEVQLPFGIAPTALQKLAHDNGEIANARAAGKLKTLFILSTISTCSIEEVAASATDTLKWFQLYVYKDREVTKSLVSRAEMAGYKAIVLTVDAPFFGIRRNDIKNNFTLPQHLKMANFEGYMANHTKSSSGSGINEYVSKLFDDSVTWEDVKWVKSLTNLPVVIKGILREDDAKKAVEYGASGIVVSNHGARQVDGTISSLDALPAVLEAVKGTNTEVYLDGGIREGTDIFKALALGAKMVFIGRPAVWGLANGGQEGVEKVLEILRLELYSTMAISGCSSVAELTPDLIIHESKISKL